MFACLLSPLFMHAAVVTETIGSTTIPGFTDGAVFGQAAFNAGVAGQPVPFDKAYGNNFGGPNFSASWTYNFSPMGGLVTNITLTLGIWDSQTQAGASAQSLTLDGTVNLTSLLNSAFAGHGGGNNEYDIYTIPIPAVFWLDVLAGNPAFSLTMQGPGFGLTAPAPFVESGLAFSELDITTTAPEPATIALFGCALAAIGLTRKLLRL
jgi:hypothetical protein